MRLCLRHRTLRLNDGTLHLAGFQGDQPLPLGNTLPFIDLNRSDGASDLALDLHPIGCLHPPGGDDRLDHVAAHHTVGRHVRPQQQLPALPIGQPTHGHDAGDQPAMPQHGCNNGAPARDHGVLMRLILVPSMLMPAINPF